MIVTLVGAGWLLRDAIDASAGRTSPRVTAVGSYLVANTHHQGVLSIWRTDTGGVQGARILLVVSSPLSRGRSLGITAGKCGSPLKRFSSEYVRSTTAVTSNALIIDPVEVDWVEVTVQTTDDPTASTDVGGVIGDLATGRLDVFVGTPNCRRPSR